MVRWVFDALVKLKGQSTKRSRGNFCARLSSYSTNNSHVKGSLLHPLGNVRLKKGGNFFPQKYEKISGWEEEWVRGGGGVKSCHLAPVVQKVDSAIHRINHYPVDNPIGFPNTYPLDSDLSSG